MRLGWTAEQCLGSSPDELAIQITGERLRRNRRLEEKAWEIAWLVSPHVGEKHKESASYERIIGTAPGYDPESPLDRNRIGRG